MIVYMFVLRVVFVLEVGVAMQMESELELELEIVLSFVEVLLSIALYVHFNRMRCTLYHVPILLSFWIGLSGSTSRNLGHS